MGKNNQSEIKLVDDFKLENIKKTVGNRKDFVSIRLNDGQNLNFINGLILSFDEVESIIKNNPKYDAIRLDIARRRVSIDEYGNSNIPGYNDYLERVIFIPHTKEFKVLHKKPNLINELIPDFVVDLYAIAVINDETIQFGNFYSENKELLHLFSRFVKIIENESDLDYLSFNFPKYNYGYSEFHTFFRCYEAFFEIENYSLYYEIKSKIIENHKDYLADITSFLEIPNNLNETYYETFGIKIDFKPEELSDALDNAIKSIKIMYDGDEAEIKNQIDIILDKYNTLTNPDKKSEYDKSLGITKSSIEKQSNFKHK